jgi:hypothetical protein
MMRPAGCLLLAASVAAALPLESTRVDFELPGTQPLTVTDPLAPPQACASCHAGYGEPEIEPVRNWRGSMMAQAGRDPLFWAALAIANQDAAHSGETCLRCHLPKGWLEGRSVPEDGSSMTAEDREGVQCTVCHRMVDPTPGPDAPPEDAAILAALAAPVASTGSAQFVIDPLDRLRGPFDVVADVGFDPHAPARATLVSPFHRSAELCGTCHDVSNPSFTCDALGCTPNPFDQPGDHATGFPEQRTYSEWAASTYAAEGVYAPQFGRNRAIVSRCQDCHMPAVTGSAARLGPVRNDLPLHEMVGGNTFVPRVLPAHPLFGAEVDAEVLAETVDKATDMLRRAATVRAWIEDGVLTVRVVNESGHKLPTGYPDGRRMWLSVRAFDAEGTVVLESGRYAFATADLVADAQLKVWETLHGLTPAWAAALGLPAGESFHLVLNDTVVKDDRIPPRGFTNAAFAVFGGAPVGAAYADGQHWDDTTYPIGDDAVAADVVLYYQTTSKEYVEFLRAENTTDAAGTILFDLWDQVDRSTPVEMARLRVERRSRAVRRCQRSVAKAQARLWKTSRREWQRCFDAEAEGGACDGAARDDRLRDASAALRAAVGGAGDTACVGRDFTPRTIGHASACPVPCAAAVTLHSMDDLATCTECLTEALAGAALASAYGAAPPALPTGVPDDALACQRKLGRAALSLAEQWSGALAACQRKQPLDPRQPRRDCAAEARARVDKATAKAARAFARCETSLADLAGCADAGGADAAAACLADALGSVAPGYATVAYP